MGKINYQKIYDKNKDEWKALVREPQKYEALLAGHYSDSNHFVYELLQNAEDERADRVVILYYSDKLVFYHNGEPFDEADVKGVSSMLMGTKDSDDAQTIGRFGMGFKSVFKYTYQPEIYSDDEAFKITNYLLPVEIDAEWDYQKEKEEIKCEVNGGNYFTPFKTAKHLTKIIIPFQKKDKDGNLQAVPGDDVLDKLNELDGEILLFLSYIKNVYWCDMETKAFARITLLENEKDNKIVTCNIQGSAYGEKENTTRYIKFKKVFDHSEMKGAEVSVAYKLNSRGDNINELKGSDVWVYFPTRDNTGLPFLIHGSFETAVSREKLMTPSAFNSDLFDELAGLIADSLDELKNRKLITQHFLRYVLMESFKDEERNETIPGLRKRVTQAFKEKKLLPNRDGVYSSVKKLMIAVPHAMCEFWGNDIFKDTFPKDLEFVAFNNEKESNFTEYYSWLKDDLGLPEFTLEDWGKNLSKLKRRNINVSSSTQIGSNNMTFMKSLYSFLSSHMEFVYDSSLSYTRSGPYERRIKEFIESAWELLRESAIVLSADGRLVSAYWKGKPCVYTGFTSKYKRVDRSALVHKDITKEYERLIQEGFKIQEFNNFQYVKEKVIAKYIDIDEGIEFEEDDYTEEYAEDIKQILELIDSISDVEQVKELLKDAYIIQVIDKNGDVVFDLPGNSYVKKSDEGIDLETYFSPVLDIERFDYDEEDRYKKEELDDSYYKYSGFNKVDEEFYLENDIDVKKLAKVGLITSPIIKGVRSESGVGDGHWVALGDYCPKVRVQFLYDNLEYINHFSSEDLAKKKSAEILKLLLSSINVFKGTVRYRKNNPYEKDEETYLLSQVLRTKRWLYTKQGELNCMTLISRHDLDKYVYGSLKYDKDIYLQLGFTEKQEDTKEDAYEIVDSLDKKDKMVLLKMLARQLGKEITEKADVEEYEDTTSDFNPDDWVSREFPEHRIKNHDNLIRQVREEFFCADPVTYQKVWRQIRVSKSSKTVRTYVTGMYTNESDKIMCQMCKEPFDASYIEAIELANLGIELPQVHLCLCKNCAIDYKNIRDKNKEIYKAWVEKMIFDPTLSDEENGRELKLSDNASIKFTEMHLVEIQEILRLLEEYGVPKKHDDDADFTGFEEQVVDVVQTVKPKSALGINIKRIGTATEQEKSVHEKEQGENANNQDETTGIRPGVRVSHKKFGTGTVLKSYDDKVDVKFGYETKTFKWPCQFLELEK